MRHLGRFLNFFGFRSAAAAAGGRSRPARLAVFLCTAVLAGIAVLAIGVTAYADITYVYDAASRLNYVIDGSGNVIQYVYDSDGNITQVNTTHPSGVSIYQLSPSSGPVGTTVTVYGVGFVPGPSNDSVSFNGTPGTITVASATKLVTTVPANATTGPVSVTNSLGSATGPTFTVQ
jgi:YD repeat-containing protein